MTSFRLVLSGPHDGAANMAVDQALLSSYEQNPTQPPVLRLYTWEPACVSLGHFQKPEDTVCLPECKSLKVDVVRRMTGGGALLHDKEVTFAFVWGKGTDGIPESIHGSYAALLQAVQKGLERLGVPTQMKPYSRRQGRESFCLIREGLYDLLWEGRKLCGSAQRRLKSAALLHGSILLDIDPDKIILCLAPEDGLDREAILAKTATLKQAMGRTPSVHEVTDALVKGVEEYFKVKVVEAGLTAQETAMANEKKEGI
jgi:lipoate-protein ligase A